MRIEKSFELQHPRALVWRRMNDVHAVAQCLPGASIEQQLGDNRYRGRMAVRIGPMAAAFDGELTIESRPEEWTAVVSGKGADARSSSRASGSMTYRLSEGAAGATRVDVMSDVNLAGALAQFGKGAIIQDIANRITNEFVSNFEARLAAAPDAPAPAAAPAVDAGGLLWSALRQRLRAVFNKLVGRSADM